jgi:hypothetical protein
LKDKEEKEESKMAAEEEENEEESIEEEVKEEIIPLDKIDISKVTRTILENKPRITHFEIKW